MRKLLCFLSLLFLSFGGSAQESLDTRIQGMFQTLKSKDAKLFVDEYLYDGIFEIIPKDSMIEVVKQIYNSEDFFIDFLKYDVKNTPKIVEKENIKYAYILSESRIKIKLNPASYIKDSIETKMRYDSLRIAMQVDTAYLNLMARYEAAETWDEETDGNPFDSPYWELPDSTETVSSTAEQMAQTIDLMEMVYTMSAKNKKEIAKLNIESNYDENSISLNNLEDSGTVAILDPKINKWKFFNNSSSSKMLVNYLVPEDVRKKLKIK